VASAPSVFLRTVIVGGTPVLLRVHVIASFWPAVIVGGAVRHDGPLGRVVVEGGSGRSYRRDVL
jgi:hypothetical protein